MPHAPPPRLYAIVATEAPVALVFRRGPSDWYHLIKWNLVDGSLEHGVWVKRKLFPERCDLSPDGSLMLFYLSGGFPPAHAVQDECYGDASEGRYRVLSGVARVPWLFPLVSWELGDTYGRGSCFGDAPFGARDAESYSIGRDRVRISKNEVHAFLNERRRGWSEAAECPPRAPDDMWDEFRNVIIEKPRPGGTEVLRLAGGPYEPGMTGKKPSYSLRRGTESTELPEAQWADWDHRGRLLIASVNGTLRIEACDWPDRSVVMEHDLHDLRPEPAPAPDWATR